MKNLPWKKCWLLWESLWTHRPLSTRHYIVLSVISILLAAWVSFSSPQSSSDKTSHIVSSEPASTYIPKGHSLVPVNILNSDNLDPLIGNFATVDIYKRTLHSKEPSALIARKIRLLRSPNNPSHFAVLSPVNQAHRFVGENLVFSVVVLPKHEGGTEFVKPKTRKRRLIMEQIQ